VPSKTTTKGSPRLLNKAVNLSIRESNFNKSITDHGEEDQIIDNMLPIMHMPHLLQPSLAITEEGSLIPETLSLKDHKNVEVK
jgi:hypothetical protein